MTPFAMAIKRHERVRVRKKGKSPGNNFLHLQGWKYCGSNSSTPPLSTGKDKIAHSRWSKRKYNLMKIRGSSQWKFAFPPSGR